MVVSVMVLENGKGSVLLSKTTSPTQHPLRGRMLRPGKISVLCPKETKQATHGNMGK